MPCATSTESDPATAALKNLIFKTMLFHLYTDASLNAKLTAVNGGIGRLLGWKKWFKPLVSFAAQFQLFFGSKVYASDHWTLQRSPWRNVELSQL